MQHLEGDRHSWRLDLDAARQTGAASSQQHNNPLCNVPFCLLQLPDAHRCEPSAQAQQHSSQRSPFIYETMMSTGVASGFYPLILTAMDVGCTVLDCTAVLIPTPENNHRQYSQETDEDNAAHRSPRGLLVPTDTKILWLRFMPARERGEWHSVAHAKTAQNRFEAVRSFLTLDRQPADAPRRSPPVGFLIGRGAKAHISESFALPIVDLTTLVQSSKVCGLISYPTLSTIRDPFSRVATFHGLLASKMILGKLSPRASRIRNKQILVAAVALVLLSTILLTSRHRNDSQSLVQSSQKANLDDDVAAGAGTAETPHHELESDPLVNDVYNRTLGFEKIFVISLPTRQDRRDSMVLGAALSDFEVELRDSVRGDEVPDKAVPIPNPKEKPDFKVMRGGVRGAWRTHMNVLREIVRVGLSSTLVMEDDGDWDIRIKDQLRDLAVASQVLTQPLAQPFSGGRLKYMDPTYPAPKNIIFPFAKEFKWSSLPETLPGSRSPYGDAWDLLWLGHCFMHLPEFADLVPKGRILKHDDPTVPQKQFLADKLQEYPHHTRVYHHVAGTACSVAYVVTQRAAREILYQVGLQPVSEALDLGIAEYCKRLDADGEERGKGREAGKGKGGQWPDEGRAAKSSKPVCLSASPALFQHYRPKGSMSAESDVSGHGNDYSEKACSDVIRWSVKLNAEEIMRGGKEYVDQYPDE
ncbi:glycosyl transferase family 25 protein [Zalerion maritima]|uniref:Glycosyl transferase family 25 protein n=1 Tax=Zalerion maritima TaxID=339359 RepID=A0AAD5RHI2_9PEZI|nr:glycosyl transferase family 25 protein [Zalerion maritima]